MMKQLLSSTKEEESFPRPHAREQAASQRRCRSVGDRVGLAISTTILVVVAYATVIYCMRVPSFIDIAFDHPRVDYQLAYEVALKEVLSNIGSRIGAVEGAVIASPSNGSISDEPDYYYTWTRDSALTISTVYPLIKDIGHAFEIETLMRSYVELQTSLQTLQTRSGDFWTGGLAEPKFSPDGTAFNGDWGRPQRDGPPLRALALIPYAHLLLDRAHPADVVYVREHLYDPQVIKTPGKVIKNDLEETAHTWSESGFDLWEEVNDHHLWTRVMSRSALQQGAALAHRLGDLGAAAYYQQAADNIQRSIHDFWNDLTGTWQAMLNPGSHSRTGLDCSFPLTMIHQQHSSNSRDIHPADDRTLATLRLFAKSFDGLYDNNGNSSWIQGRALGRYAEDIYDGVGTSAGNPWFICTFSFAHALQLTLNHIKATGRITITDLSAPFWADILRHNKASHKHWSSFSRVVAHQGLLQDLQSVVDAYIAVGERYQGPSGSMSEQIDSRTGALRGARDLTWSYASYMSLLKVTGRA